MPVPFLAVLAVPFTIAAPAQHDEASVRAFMGWIYSHYRDGGDGVALDEKLFDPDLAAAIRKDRASDEPGLDFDPICDCQDFAGLQAPLIHNVSIVRDRAWVSASLVYGENGNDVTTIHFSLVRLAGGWRVSDIEWPGGRSLRALYFGKPLPTPR